jgi:Domain of unknown function (DUF4838)
VTDVCDLTQAARGTVWCPAEAAPAIHFAAAELAHYVERLTGISPPRATVPGDGNHLWLQPTPPERTPGLRGDAHIDAAEAGVGITGARPRDVLAAVYRLLGAVGCRWSPRGSAYDVLPPRTQAPLPVASADHRPAFARRAYASDLTTWHYSMPERYAARLPQDLAFIEWMAKTGATGWLFIRHAHDDRWLLPELVEALHARGLDAEWGGHGLVEWLPRSAFTTHPEYFPADADGRRTDMGNCCTSHPGALALVVDGVETARAATSAGDLHLWGLDLFGGGWCHCPDCRALSPSDQALRLGNAIAASLPTPERLFHLAYHDTIHPPRTVRPHARVWAEFAPRERCYAHAIDDPACHVNPRYRRALEAHLEWFDGRVDVFEYYADTILFGGCAVPLVGVIERDLAFYQRAGVGGVSCLTFGRFSQLAHGANLTAFAAGTINPAATRDGRRAHCTDAFGSAASAAEHYLVALEDAIAPLLAWGDLKAPPRHGPAAAAVAAALAATAARRHHLERALAPLPRTARTRAEQHLLRYTIGTVEGLSAILAGTPALDDTLAALRGLASSFEDADLEQAGTWGRVDLSITHSFYEAGLRGASRSRAPFPDDEE